MLCHNKNFLLSITNVLVFLLKHPYVKYNAFSVQVGGYYGIFHHSETAAKVTFHQSCPENGRNINIEVFWYFFFLFLENLVVSLT